ncbi:hypothetical protein Tco_1259665, partial [Tanacetum coccineum]
MCRQPLPPPLSPSSAKLMIMALEEYGKMFDDIMVNSCKDDFKKCRGLRSLMSNAKVSDIQQKDKNKEKRTKLSTRIERVREIEAEG